MILLFEDFINEGRDADLYHWMNDDKAPALYDEDVMYGKWIHNIDGIKRNGNSFTRNKNLNYSYIIRLVIDQAKLSSRYRIIPIDGEKVYHDTEKDGRIISDRDPTKFSAGKKYGKEERYKNFNQQILAEEFIIGDIKKMHTYIKRVEVFDNIGFSYIDEDNLSKMRLYCDRWNIPMIENKRSNL